MCTVDQVFVAGGQPTVTYVPRAADATESITGYIARAGRPLLVVGPPRSGKTVLLRRLAAPAVRIAGAELGSVEEFWGEIVDQFGAYTGETAETFVEEGEDSSDAHGASAKLGGSGIEGSSASVKRDTSGRRHAQSRSRPLRRVAKVELVERRLPLVIDDFTRIDLALQSQLVDAVRDLAFEGVPVILVATSWPGWDLSALTATAVGEGEQVVVYPWATVELEAIAVRGLTALNVAYDPGLVVRLAGASRRSPCLMQFLLLRICCDNGVVERFDRSPYLRVGRNFDDWAARQLASVPVVHALSQLGGMQWNGGSWSA